MGKRKEEKARALKEEKARALIALIQRTEKAVSESNHLTSGETYYNMYNTGIIDYNKKELDRLSKILFDSANTGDLTHAESIYLRIEKLLDNVKSAPERDRSHRAAAKEQ